MSGRGAVAGSIPPPPPPAGGQHWSASAGARRPPSNSASAARRLSNSRTAHAWWDRRGPAPVTAANAAPAGRRIGCRSRGEEMPLIFFTPFLALPLLSRGGKKCRRGTNSSAGWFFFFSLKEIMRSTTFKASGKAAGLRGVFTPVQSSLAQKALAPRARLARASSEMRALRPARRPRGPVPQKPRRREGGRAQASEEKASPSRLRASAAACAASAQAPRGSIEKLSVSFTNRRRGGPGRKLSERGRQRGAGRRGGRAEWRGRGCGRRGNSPTGGRGRRD